MLNPPPCYEVVVIDTWRFFEARSSPYLCKDFLIIKTVSHGTDNRQINFRIYVHNLLERMAQENEADLEDKMQCVAKCRRVSHLESQMRRYR